jgi:hypothetical protein
MSMDMTFPHSRSGAKIRTTKADYSALVASAMTRQASSSTVRALLNAPMGLGAEADGLESRIKFFARSDAKTRRHARGAFLPVRQIEDSKPAAKAESAVNRADSTNGKDDQLETVQPELQVAERGTEF